MKLISNAPTFIIDHIVFSLEEDITSQYVYVQILIGPLFQQIVDSATVVFSTLSGCKYWEVSSFSTS